MRFKPAGAWAFVGAPMATCTDRRVDLAALHGARRGRRAARASLRRRRRRGGAARRARAATSAGRSRCATAAATPPSSAASSACWRAKAASRSPSSARSPGSASASCSAASPRSSASRRARSRVVVRLRRVFDALRDAPWSTLVRARAGGRLLRPSADGARLPPPARPRAVAVGARGRGLGDEPGRPRRLTLSQSYKPARAALPILGALLRRRTAMRTIARPRARDDDAVVPARAAAPPDLVVARRRLAPLQGRRDRRGALARPARRHADRRQPDDVEGQGELREPAHRPQRRHLDVLGLRRWGARRCRSAWSRAVPQRAVFANPEHDFPARIVYWREGDELLARIEGTLRDKPAAVEWRFAKGTAADCPQAP